MAIEAFAPPPAPEALMTGQEQKAAKKKKVQETLKGKLRQRNDDTDAPRDDDREGGLGIFNRQRRDRGGVNVSLRKNRTGIFGRRRRERDGP